MNLKNLYRQSYKHKTNFSSTTYRLGFWHWQRNCSQGCWCCHGTPCHSARDCTFIFCCCCCPCTNSKQYWRFWCLWRSIQSLKWGIIPFLSEDLLHKFYYIWRHVAYKWSLNLLKLISYCCWALYCNFFF